MRHFLNGFLWIQALLLLGSCYPDGPEYVEDLDVVYTNYDPDFSFADQRTFAIPDSIVLIEGQNYVANRRDSVPATVDSVYAKPILALIRKNLASRGWTEVDRTENPDVLVLVSANRTTNLYYNYDWRYWDWWYPGAYADYGWYYPNYFPNYGQGPGYLSGYCSGSLLMQIANPSAAGVNHNVPVVWVGDDQRIAGRQYRKHQQPPEPNY